MYLNPHFTEEDTEAYSVKKMYSRSEKNKMQEQNQFSKSWSMLLNSGFLL